MIEMRCNVFKLHRILYIKHEEKKLMLARAIYKEGAILVLDEPTAVLDPIAEAQYYTEEQPCAAGIM